MRPQKWVHRMLIGSFVALLAACDGQPTTESEVLAALVASNRCADLNAELSPADSALTRSESCALVAVAIDALGAIPTTAGLPLPSDTSLINGASIVSMMEETVTGEPVGSWWVVTLNLAEKQYDVDVRVSKTDGETEVFVVHK